MITSPKKIINIKHEWSDYNTISINVLHMWICEANCKTQIREKLSYIQHLLRCHLNSRKNKELSFKSAFLAKWSVECTAYWKWLAINGISDPKMGNKILNLQFNLALKLSQFKVCLGISPEWLTFPPTFLSGTGEKWIFHQRLLKALFQVYLQLS